MNARSSAAGTYDPAHPANGAGAKTPGWRKVMVVGLGALAIALCAFLWLYDPQERTIFVCVFRMLTGLYCPGCGATRAMHLLMHLHPYAAFRMNPLLVLLLPFIGYCILDETIPWAFGRRIVPHLRISAKAAWTIAIVVVAYSLLRNVPVAPFIWLIPTVV